MRSNAALFRSMSRAEDRLLAAVMPRLAALDVKETPKVERIVPRLTYTIAEAAHV